jgi:hypothetical protein
MCSGLGSAGPQLLAIDDPATMRSNSRSADARRIGAGAGLAKKLAPSGFAQQ